MADATSDRKELEIMKRLIDIETVCIPVLDRVWPYLSMYDSFLIRIGHMAIVWKRIHLCPLMDTLESTVPQIFKLCPMR